MQNKCPPTSQLATSSPFSFHNRTVYTAILTRKSLQEQKALAVHPSVLTRSPLNLHTSIFLRRGELYNRFLQTNNRMTGLSPCRVFIHCPLLFHCLIVIS